MQLKDQFGRVHDYLRLSLIDKCNLRCTYCMPEDIRFLPPKHLMGKEELLKIATTFVRDFGVKKIRLTGGEPLLRKDAPEIMEKLAELPVDLAITTNGVLLHEFLPLFNRIGLKSLNISLDTLRQDRFLSLTRRDQFGKVMQNIERALGQGFRIKINVVSMRGVNVDEIMAFVAWSERAEVHIRFIEFMPFDGNNWHWNKVYPLKDILSDIRKGYELDKLNDGPNPVAKVWRVKGGAGTFAVISSVSQAFCSTCNRIRLTADGKLRNCLFSRGETDLLAALREGEDMKPLILDSILNKHERLGGLPEFEDSEAIKKALSRRAMVKIGG